MSTEGQFLTVAEGPSVNTLKHVYLGSQKADRNQILSKASLGWGIDCIRFWARSDWNSGFHGNR